MPQSMLLLTKLTNLIVKDAPQHAITYETNEFDNQRCPKASYYLRNQRIWYSKMAHSKLWFTKATNCKPFASYCTAPQSSHAGCYNMRDLIWKFCQLLDESGVFEALEEMVSSGPNTQQTNTPHRIPGRGVNLKKSRPTADFLKMI